MIVLNATIVGVIFFVLLTVIRDVVVHRWYKYMNSLKEEERPPVEVTRRISVLAMMRMMFSANRTRMSALIDATVKARRSSIQSNIEHSVSMSMMLQKAVRRSQAFGVPVGTVAASSTAAGRTSTTAASLAWAAALPGHSTTAATAATSSSSSTTH
jgi:hypothetical protein